MLLPCSDLCAQFVDVASELGLNYTQSGPAPAQASEHRFMTGGAATADFNNDGYADLFVTRLDAPDILYLNDGGNGFIDVSAQAGFTETYPSNGAAWGDIDNDGDADLYVTGIGVQSYRLYLNNGDGSFSEEASDRNAGIEIGGTNFGFSPAFGDYDSDGNLDLFVSEWLNAQGVSHVRLLRNEGGAQAGHFTDTTVAAGLEIPSPYLFSPRFSDLDNDGHQDLVIAGDFGTSKLFWNNGDGTFLDGTVAANVGTDENGMGLSVGDFNDDGQLDFFITAIASDQEPCQFCNWGTSGNRLFQNLGNRQFEDVTTAAGVRDAAWGWGTSFFDYDNDGDLDLVATNGISFPFEVVEEEFENQPMRLWRNDGGVFVDVSSELGTSDGIRGSGKGLLVFDFDNDGDVDVFCVNNAGQPVLLRNDFQSNNDWLRINLEGTQSNRDGMGAKITVTPDLDSPEDFIYREVDGGSNFLGQNERTAHFGLAPGDETVDLITIVWPSGQRDTLSDIDRRSVITIVEGESLSTGDFDGDGDVDIDDIESFTGNIGKPILVTPASSADPLLERLDLNSDQTIDLADLNIHVTQYVETSNGQTGTFMGDLNLDGTVDVSGDAFALIGNLGRSGGWAEGDFDQDGEVTVLGDAFPLVANLGNSNAP
ncbi:CRTAC1 family protein [Mariniblastus sp.]|nr:CRTAC1 family protein [Mariniblastus sp.]